MKSFISKITSREVRKYLYSVAIAFFGLAAWKGWIEPEALPLLVPLVVAILNLTPKDTNPELEQEGETAILTEDL